MNLYRVRVECWTLSDLGIERRKKRCFLLEADDVTQAMQLGRDHAEMDTPGSVKLLEVTAREAARVELPLEVPA